MKLYVGNLSKQVTKEQFRDLATPYGEPVSADVVMDDSRGESRGFGFIEFGNSTEGMAAITGLDGRDVNGQILKVNEAKPRR